MTHQHGDILLVEVPADTINADIIDGHLVDSWADEEWMPIQKLPSGNYTILGLAKDLTEEQWSSLIETKKYLIEDFRNNKWLCLGPMFDSSKNFMEQEELRWTNDANHAIQWDTAKEAQEHFIKYHNQIDMGVTEHLFYACQLGESSTASGLSLVASYGMKPGNCLILKKANPSQTT